MSPSDLEVGALYLIPGYGIRRYLGPYPPPPRYRGPIPGPGLCFADCGPHPLTISAAAEDVLRRITKEDIPWLRRKVLEARHRLPWLAEETELIIKEVSCQSEDQTPSSPEGSVSS